MKKVLPLLMALLVAWQLSPAQLMGNLLSSHLTSTSSDITKIEGDGFMAEYYNGSNFEQKVFSRVEKTIDFFLIHQSPAAGIDADYFSVRWTGKLYAPRTGTYTFIFVADDGVRLWVNNKLLIDRWYLNRATPFSGKIALQGKQVYNLKIEYSQMKPSAAVARASWIIEDGPEEPIDPRFVFSSAKKLPPVASVKKPAPATNKSSQEPLEGKAVVKKSTPAKKTTPAKEVTASVKATKKAPIKPVEKAAAIKEKELPVEIFENLEIGKSVVLNHIFFDQSKHELRSESYDELNKLVNTLRKYPAMKILISGHTDNVGDFNLNVQLSRERAKAVADYLVEKGIARERIDHKGYGGLHPVAPNTTEDNKKKNRRVEFMVATVD